MMRMNLSHIAFLDIYSFDYCGIINRNRKSEAINLLQNIDLNEKKWNVKKQNIKTYYHI